jgi:carbonic anhydrase/acetyltransferase-like protein (isoleucine patch superfamily)
MKYRLTNKSKNYFGFTVYQIQAVNDFGSVKTGDLGGWVENEYNLSQDGYCWISNNAVALRNSRVYHNAQIMDDATITGYARVCGNAVVKDQAQVSGFAQIRDESIIYDNSLITDHTMVTDNSMVGGNSLVFKYAKLGSNAKVASYQHIQGNVVSDISDIRTNLIENISAQTGLKVFNGEVYCYKHVRRDLTSTFDKRFRYSVGKYIEEPNTDNDQFNCNTPGLYVSNAESSNKLISTTDLKLLFCRVNINDIVSVQRGQIRCNRLFVIGVCDD